MARHMGLNSLLDGLLRRAFFLHAVCQENALLLEQRADRIGWLSAVVKPIVDAVHGHGDGGGFVERGVSTQIFNVPSVARVTCVRCNNGIERALAPAHAFQSKFNCHVYSNIG